MRTILVMLLLAIGIGAAEAECVEVKYYTGRVLILRRLNVRKRRAALSIRYVMTRKSASWLSSSRTRDIRIAASLQKRWTL
jgi:hypothetical protein